MTNTLVFAGAKGGSGTSTVAAMVALAAAQDRKVFLSAIDQGDLCAILGLPQPHDGDVIEVSPGLMLGSPSQAVEVDLIVHDVGTLAPYSSVPDYIDSSAVSYLVVRPCYVALRRAVDLDRARFSGVVLLEEPGRSLGYRDVEAALGMTVVARVPVLDTTARVIDAGLLAYTPSKVPSLARLVPTLVRA